VVEVEDDDPVGCKRKLRSAVWLDFDLVKVNGLWKAKCKWCKKLLGGETRNGTTHLKNHLAVCDDRITRKGLTQSPRYATFFCQLGSGRAVIFQ
jgi:hypothetical protein